MGLNTCRKQWKEQRKQNKIEKSENTEHKLSQDVFTLQMQVTTANNQNGHRVTMRQSAQWHESNLSYKAQGILECITVTLIARKASSSGFPLGVRNSVSVMVLSEVPLTHLKSCLFQATTQLAPWCSNNTGAF